MIGFHGFGIERRESYVVTQELNFSQSLQPFNSKKMQ